MSRGAWAFISGGLFYILFGIYFLFELTKKKMSKNKWKELYKDDEWFDIVDENGNVKGKAPRTICHSGPGMLHSVVHLHIIDNKNRIFLQKRIKTKKIQPGKWDTAVGGHVNSGEKIEDALKRETEEELNIKDIQTSFIGKYIWETPFESELVHVFIGRYSKIITVNPDEIEEGKFWKIKKIKDAIGKEIFTPNFEQEFKFISELIIKF
jgi:isopentenyldiphosphate isomerase